jgi:hypothetical protein
MMDWRWRPLLEELLFPSPKEEMGPRSIAYLRLVLADKRGSVMMPTFPRSGQHWTADILGYALVKRHRGAAFRLKPGPGSFRERLEDPLRLLCPADSRSRHEARLRDRLPGAKIDWLFHTHYHWHGAALWGLDAARHVFVIRNLPTTLYSCYLNRRRVIEYSGFEDFLVRSPFLPQAVLFYNTWHLFARRHPERLRIFRYEELRRDAAAGFAAMYEWIFAEPAPADLIGEALVEFSLDRMKKAESQKPADPWRPNYYLGAESYCEEMPPPALAMIQERLARELACDWPGLKI